MKSEKETAKKKSAKTVSAKKKSPAAAAKSKKARPARPARASGIANGRHGKIGMIVLKIMIVCAVCGLLGATALLSVSAAMVRTTRDRVISAEDAAELSDVDCILVLGCGVTPDGRPSVMLSDRVRVGIDLYLNGASDRLLMSGDHGRDDYDEVNVMKALATAEGIDPDAVFCDHAGFSTWDSMVRAKKIFGAEKVIIVTQEYHLYRALYMAEKLGLEAYGVSATLQDYGGQWLRDLREVGARFKGFVYELLDVPPRFLGDPIPLDGKGSSTDG